MYDNNFSGVNNSNVENMEHEPEAKAEINSDTNSTINSNPYNSSINAYGDSNANGAYSSNVYNSSYNNSSAAESSSAYSNNASSASYVSANTVGNTYSSANTAGDTYNSANTAGSTYSSFNTEESTYSSANTAGDTYGSANTPGSTYSSVNTAGSTYGSVNTSGNTYGSNAHIAGDTYNGTTGSSNSNNAYSYSTGTWSGANYRQNDNNYQYGNAYFNNDTGIKKEKKKKEKKKREKTENGYFKKVLVCVSLGLFFGVCAGFGFYAVESIMGTFGNTTNVANNSYAIGESADADTEDASDVVSSSVSYDMNGSDIQKTQTVTTVVSDVSDVVTAVMPAVVSISNTYTERMSYFGQTMTSEAEASGSGIIVGKNDTELLIVTNYHVIEDADTLKVQFVENSEVEAFVKGTDPDMDLAVISVSLDSIESSTLEQIAIATLGDSDALKVGEPAIAIGNSLGYGQSVTTGVVSALNRDMELSDGSTGTFIQTDAAINPGNSGGALLNIKGEVIGINSNKIGGSVIEGMGYAIPISAASPIIAELMLKETKNKVAEDERGFLGISGISVTSEVSSAYGMPEGVYIAQVYEGTAAAAAGLVKGDIITEFDGEDISSMEELQTVLEYYAKGDTVEITVMTVGNGGYTSRTVSITLGNKVG